jgi:hypothetical protein
MCVAMRAASCGYYQGSEQQGVREACHSTSPQRVLAGAGLPCQQQQWLLLVHLPQWRQQQQVLQKFHAPRVFSFRVQGKLLLSNQQVVGSAA